MILAPFVGYRLRMEGGIETAVEDAEIRFVDNDDAAVIHSIGDLVRGILTSIPVPKCDDDSPSNEEGGESDSKVSGGGHLGGLPRGDGQDVDYGLDEALGLREVDRVTRSAQLSHSVAKGPSISQRECAGLNWPPLAIRASEPVSISPEAVSRAGPTSETDFLNSALRQPGCGSYAAPRPSATLGVGQPHRSTVRRELSLFPAGLFPFCAGVPAIGVGHPASIAKSFRSLDRSGFVARFACPPPVMSLAWGVGQPAAHTALPSRALTGTFEQSAPSLWSLLVGVGHPIEALADVRCAEARSAGIRRPNGVTQHFQRSRYSVEPSAAVIGRNLLSKDEFRAALADESEKLGEQVPAVRLPFVPASDAIERSSSDSVRHRAARVALRTSKVGAGAAEGGTGAGSGPDWPIIGETGFAKGEAPGSDPCEEMALNKSGEVVWSNVTNIPFIHDAGSDQALGDELAQPGRGEWVVFVVEGAHGSGPPHDSLPCLFREGRDADCVVDAATPVHRRAKLDAMGTAADLDDGSAPIRKRRDGHRSVPDILKANDLALCWLIGSLPRLQRAASDSPWCGVFRCVPSSPTSRLKSRSRPKPRLSLGRMGLSFRCPSAYVGRTRRGLLRALPSMIAETSFASSGTKEGRRGGSASGPNSGNKGKPRLRADIYAASWLSRALAMTGEMAEAFRTPSVAASIFSANSGGQSTTLRS